MSGRSALGSWQGEQRACLGGGPWHHPAMLILSRTVGQSIVIDGKIIVKVVRFDGDQIKLGIQAPDDVRVNREEVQRDIDAGKLPPVAARSALKSILGLGE